MTTLDSATPVEMDEAADDNDKDTKGTPSKQGQRG
jgi:hypothetical protein